MTKNTKIVLIIVGACCTFGLTFLLILAALVIPATQSVIRHGNEASAMNVLKLINTEEQAYNMMYPQRGYACSLAQLGGNERTGPASADAAQLIPDELSSGHKAGYSFMFQSCVKSTIKGQDQVTSYKLTAIPIDLGHTGQFGYCTNETGQITFDRKGGVNCTEPLQ